MTATFGWRTENNKNRNAQKKKQTNKKTKQKQKQKEMKTHLSKNKVVQKSCFKASPVYTFISILTHVK